MIAPDSRAHLARRQAEIPLIVLFKIAEPALSKFSGAIFSAKNGFALADLTNSDFRIRDKVGSHLEMMDFTLATLDNAAVDGLDFGKNKMVTKSQLEKACSCSGLPPKLNGIVIKVDACMPFKDETGWEPKMISVCESH